MLDLLVRMISPRLKISEFARTSIPTTLLVCGPFNWQKAPASIVNWHESIVHTPPMYICASTLIKELVNEQGPAVATCPAVNAPPDTATLGSTISDAIVMALAAALTFVRMKALSPGAGILKACCNMPLLSG